MQKALRLISNLLFTVILSAITSLAYSQSNTSVATAKVIDSFPHVESNVNTTNGGTAAGMIGSCSNLPCCAVWVYKVVLPLEGSLRIENDNFVNFSGSIIAYTALVDTPTTWSDLTYYSSFGNPCGFRDSMQLGYGYQWPQFDPAAPNAGIYYDVSKAVPAGEYYILIFNQNQQINMGSSPSSNFTFEFAPACPVRNSVINASVCAGESIMVNGTVYDTTVVGAIEVIDDNGPFDCDSTVTINLTVLPEKTGVLNQTICAGESLTINGTIYSGSVSGAVEVFNNVGPQNCDSTLTINLTVLPAKTSQYTSTLCAGDSLILNGSVYKQSVSGVEEVFQNVGPFGCDSTVLIDLTVLPVKDSTLYATICYGESIIVNGTVYDSAVTQVKEVIPNGGAYGCDSTVWVNLNVLPERSSKLELELCAGEGILLNNTFYDYSVTGAQVVFPDIGPYGCDSTVILNLSIKEALNSTIDQTGAVLSAQLAEAEYQWLDCFNGFAAIPNATSQSFSPAENGEYAVALFKNGCIDTSTCVGVFSVSIADEYEQTPQFQLFPNPTRGLVEIRVEGPIDPEGKVEIYSLEQKRLQTFDLDRPRRTLDLRKLPKGIYLIHYQNQVQKLVLNPE
ncbi:MAG: T9SS type A sorting domain-containing protein [Bacteroidota bacterium]